MNARYIRSLIALTICLGAACHTPEGVIASSDLVRLELERTPNAHILQLIPASGAQINAQFKPTIENSDGTLIVLDSPEVTADSEYFVAAPRISIDRDRRVEGPLRASVCPAGKRVCLTVELPVQIR